MNRQKWAISILRPRTRANTRQGAVLVAALVCLLVVMAMLGAMLKGALLAQRQLHRERDLRQTELLLQAGSDRAAYRLANDANYRGENWKLPANAIVDNGEGQVTIEASATGAPSVWSVKVVAEYPLGGETSIRRSRTFQVPSQNPRK
jgi:hypothetical protein